LRGPGEPLDLVQTEEAQHKLVLYGGRCVGVRQPRISMPARSQLYSRANHRLFNHMVEKNREDNEQSDQQRQAAAPRLNGRPAS
jgi:hypothetical protein